MPEFGYLDNDHCSCGRLKCGLMKTSKENRSVTQFSDIHDKPDILMITFLGSGNQDNHDILMIIFLWLKKIIYSFMCTGVIKNPSLL